MAEFGQLTQITVAGEKAHSGELCKSSCMHLQSSRQTFKSRPLPCRQSGKPAEHKGKWQSGGQRETSGCFSSNETRFSFGNAWILLADPSSIPTDRRKPSGLPASK
ncbi:LOW QUALITY PROTEIN: hypothetical protein ENH_00008530 [Eimeria necatrix]|uniref:Uncharacterized protein n=1 Tax=Eimeria necatrix TaxID=51315 RepID=U6MT71_9EIME|nr:LOW QUALITY PROTEIN: hypothetical protein ENH_00008530 [Eimeria necatrix]CDJ65644.1 hypothetical protein ENH_00008530 [Eimeria necatrix]